MSVQSMSQRASLLSAADAYADYLSLRRALLNDSSPSEPLMVSPEIVSLVKELVKLGVCHDEAEVLSRAVRAFFVAVFPLEAERQRLLRETIAPH